MYVVINLFGCVRTNVSVMHVCVSPNMLASLLLVNTAAGIYDSGGTRCWRGM